MYDIIFAGAGAAACVTAGKLAAADPTLKILVLEAGPHSFNVPSHLQPGLHYPRLVRPDPLRKVMTTHVGRPTEALLGRGIAIPTGKVVGGGSSVNGMMYTRASASDYDTWEHQYGNKGWSAKDLIPLLAQIETFHPYDVNGPALPLHGQSGPIKISFQRQHVNLAKEFLKVASKYDTVREVKADVNDFRTANGYAMWAKYINPANGRRSDAAHNFLYNQPHNSYLVIEAEKRVVRVLFEGTKAVGVEYIDARKGDKTTLPVAKKVFASRLVVISSGCFSSPAILERSGIGKADVLKANGIPQLVDLPGVGEHYTDHPLAFAHYHVSDDAETMDAIFHGTENDLKVHVAEWEATGKGLLSQNSVNAGFKLRPTAEELKELGPAFLKQWERVFANAPDKPVMVSGMAAAFCGPEKPPTVNKAFNFLYYATHPASVGHVHITGGLDTYAPLDFAPALFEDEGDVAIFRWTYKHSREIARRMASYRGEIEGWQPAFPEGSEAACKYPTQPVSVGAPKLKYTKEDDEAIDRFHRQTLGTSWHGAGTCSMKPRESGGVVDSKLNIYGTTNLKVADLSICPDNISANTYNTALAVGIKAALIIAEELGLPGYNRILSHL